MIYYQSATYHWRTDPNPSEARHGRSQNSRPLQSSCRSPSETAIARSNEHRKMPQHSPQHQTHQPSRLQIGLSFHLCVGCWIRAPTVVFHESAIKQSPGPVYGEPYRKMRISSHHRLCPCLRSYRVGRRQLHLLVLATRRRSGSIIFETLANQFTDIQSPPYQRSMESMAGRVWPLHFK